MAGVSNCDRCYHVYVGITFFEGSAPKKLSKKEALIFQRFYIVHHYLECVISWRADGDAAFSFCGVSSVEMVSCITTYIPTAEKKNKQKITEFTDLIRLTFMVC